MQLKEKVKHFIIGTDARQRPASLEQAKIDKDLHYAKRACDEALRELETLCDTAHKLTKFKGKSDPATAINE